MGARQAGDAIILSCGAGSASSFLFFFVFYDGKGDDAAAAVDAVKGAGCNDGKEDEG
jgi:hypothetical protein